MNRHLPTQEYGYQYWYDYQYQYEYCTIRGEKR